MAQYTNPYYTGIKFPKWGSQDVRGFGDSNASPLDEPGLFPKDQQPNGNWLDDNIGGITTAFTGAVGLAGNYMNMANQGLGINMDVAPVQYSQDQAPTYTGGQLASQISGAKPQGAQAGEILSGVGQGAAAGSAFGPIGAGVGAVVGGVTSIVGGARRKRKQRRELRQARQSLQQAQGSYNTADVSYRERANQMEDYFERMNSNNKMFNVNRSQY